MARPVLEAMVEATKPGGRLLVTGFTQTFLRPRLFEDLRLDVELGAFFDELDERVGRGRWVAALSADHGVLPLPEYVADRGQPALRVPLAEAGSFLGAGCG